MMPGVRGVGWSGPCDLRRGVAVFSGMQIGIAAPRLAAAAVAVWAAGAVYLALVPGAIMYGLAGWAGLCASRDRRLVRCWDPRVQAAAELCTKLGCMADAVDIAALSYLLVWQSMHRAGVGMVVFVAVQQSFLVGLESCMLLVLWSYHRRLRAFQPVMPLQVALLVPEEESVDTDAPGAGSLSGLFSLSPLANPLEPRRALERPQNPPPGRPWLWKRLKMADEMLPLVDGSCDGRSRGVATEGFAATNRDAVQYGDRLGELVDIEIVVPQPSGMHRHGMLQEGHAASPGVMQVASSRMGSARGAAWGASGDEEMFVRVVS